MSEAEPTSSTSSAEWSGNRPQLYKLIFDQNLDEVHLLIDFVSGRIGRSLTTLTIPGRDRGSDPMTSREIIQAVADMRFPPKGPDAINAGNAGLLLLAKDALSALAAPATGLTIAYTAMFVDAEVKTGPRRAFTWLSGLLSRQRRTRGNQIERKDIRQTEKNNGADQRVDLAVRAFPVLQEHARRFRRWRDGLATFCVVWLLLTALAYWDAGLGRVALERLDQNWKVFIDELRDDPTLLACDEQPPAVLKPAVDAKVNLDAARAELACRRHAYQLWKGDSARKEVQSVFRCEQMTTFGKVLHVWCWQWLLARYDPEKPITNNPEETRSAGALVRTSGPDAADSQVRMREPSQEIKDNATYWQTATSRLSVFTTYVLPMMFALLGTLISAFRAIINRVRDCTLAPRDFVRMLLGIPTGLVAGVAVGLFLSPSSVPIQGSGGLAGQVTLTAIGFGFIAGYASHSFFNYLDTVVGAAFPAAANETVPVAGSAHIGTANGDPVRPGGDARAGAVEPSTATAGSMATAAPTSAASVPAGRGD